ncbi:hypothetical protein [Kaistella carnis]|nr:hypothetical protein [Kaistella carnis]
MANCNTFSYQYIMTYYHFIRTMRKDWWTIKIAPEFKLLPNEQL